MEIRRPIEFPIPSFEIERASCHESRMGKTHFSKTGEIFQDARLVCLARGGEGNICRRIFVYTSRRCNKFIFSSILYKYTQIIIYEQIFMLFLAPAVSIESTV